MQIFYIRIDSLKTCPISQDYLGFLKDFILVRSYLRFVEELYTIVKSILPRLNPKIKSCVGLKVVR